jgi:hypothetical protein
MNGVVISNGQLAEALLISRRGCGWIERLIGGQVFMRVLSVVALCAILGGCAASKQEVVARLGDQYIGQNVDTLIVQFGPPTSAFKMNSGQIS